MTALTLTKTKMQTGQWQGILTGSADLPAITVTHLGRSVDTVTVQPGTEPDTWVVRIAIPPEVISDGVQTLLIQDAATDTTLDSITLIAGEALGDDLRTEVDLLRAELDVLKRAFRRHCVETT